MTKSNLELQVIALSPTLPLALPPLGVSFNVFSPLPPSDHIETLKAPLQEGEAEESKEIAEMSIFLLL